MLRDNDLAPVSVRCHREPTPKDPKHVSCAPAVFVSPVAWDVVDNTLMRPVSHGLGVVTSGESVDVNSLDEVPDSSWFENRIGARDMPLAELTQGGCKPEDLLDPEAATEGSWVIDQGKSEGSQPGFRITTPGKRRYLVKLDPEEEHERTSAASVLGIAVHHAAGFHTTCEQLLYVKPRTFRLLPGLRSKTNIGDERPFDQHALDAIVAAAPWRDGRVRVVASAWLPGHLIGPFRYEGTRADDPNDVVAHEDRRELRALRVLDAWLARYDSRSGNTIDSWMHDGHGPPEASPGHVVHYHLDTSEIFGADPGGDPSIWQREGHSYIVDFADVGRDFVTLGIPTRPWDTATKTPGLEIFGYFNVEDFTPDRWKSEYPNPAFVRMTERDAAWMTRILARFSHERIHALVELGSFTDPRMSAFLERVLEGRLARILERYLLRRSPMTDARVEGQSLCVTDLAALRAVRDPSQFRYAARTSRGALSVARKEGANVCFALPGGGGGDLELTMENGVARGPLVAMLHDAQDGRGYRVTALRRPEE
jgi:hypothetical protein